MTEQTYVSDGPVDSEQARDLRDGMVAALQTQGVLHSPEVVAAIRTVPRHVFGPEDGLESAYALRTVLHRTLDETGVAVSMISAVDIQALMLEQAQIGPGMRVLEVGSGGYNAALLAELVGPDGQVTTVDIDPRVTERSVQYLARAGYERVNVVLADADAGVPEHAPYDRIVVTTSVADLPPSWIEQLAPEGRIVVPLRMRGITRVVVLRREGAGLVGAEYELAQFVPMRGAASPAERYLELADGVTLLIDSDLPIDPGALRGSLAQPRVEAWGEVTGVERFDGLHLWLMVNEPMFGIITATKAAAEAGLIAHAWPLGLPTVLDESGASFAYLSLRRFDDGLRFGAMGQGPRGQEMADRLVSLIGSWDESNLDATIAVYPAGTPDDAISISGRVRVLDRPRNRVAITWPTPQES
ncbi:methyltransferase, FxLD system [Promicromonospora sp. NPDC057138]|uniref:methyltransferase, FxLD system n=1 Tax=Promicromonospora sp. NPDC057138 TaxID=3346031 RepID=UPI0036333844